MRRILAVAFSAILAFSMIMNYQVSYADQDEEKDKEPKSSHISESESDSNGHDPIYEGNETIVVKFDDYDTNTKVRVTKPGSDNSIEYEHEEGSVTLGLSDILKAFEDEESGNQGGVYKVEITDSNGKTKTKNIKIKEQTKPEAEEGSNGEEPINKDNTSPSDQGNNDPANETGNQQQENPVGNSGGSSDPDSADIGQDENEEDQDEDEKDEDLPIIEEPEAEDESQVGLDNSDKEAKQPEKAIESANTEIEASLELETVEIDQEEELIPEAPLTIEVEEINEAPQSAPAAPATLPSTGASSPIEVSSLGAALLALGLLIGKKK